ncbi:hypothetical protein [Paenibacillus sp. 22594]|uniref:hypothetical protein n=1 Tax=Paenibacillus sp. 22594 TaxID=3453947 RepID=UPI003F8524FF
MSRSVLIKRVTSRLSSKVITTVILKQNDINIKVRDELGHILLIDAADSGEMFLLASLFQHSMRSHDLIYLERKDTVDTDLFIFNGAINPFTQKDLKKIRSSLRFFRTDNYRIPLLSTHDEKIWEAWEHWKYDEQLRIKSGKDMAIINSSQLGFEMLVHSCCYLATSYSGHSHFDWNSTNSSPELIIRNIARN